MHTAHYGVLNQTTNETKLDEHVEEITRLGYTIIPSNFDQMLLAELGLVLAHVEQKQIAKYGEKNTIRCPLQYDPIFLKPAAHSTVLAIINKLIQGQFVLNQQNGVINPPAGNQYEQAAFHRDFPYQHFTSSSPLGISALLCLDEFTKENGATLVVPASHKFTAYPSEQYLKKHTINTTANPGDIIILDCMTYHAGGINKTKQPRRGINHVYTIPYFKQQIDIPNLINYKDELSDEHKQLLGFNYPYIYTQAEFYKRHKTHVPDQDT